MSLGAIVLVGLASYRVARLVTKDTICEPLRRVVYDWAWIDPQVKGQDPKPRAGGARTWLYSLLSCPLCFGVWTSALLMLLWAAVTPVDVGWRWAASLAAVAGVQSLVALADAALEAIPDLVRRDDE